MKIHISCIFQGEDFDPTPFLTMEQLEVREYDCVGDVYKRGRHKGQVVEDGYIDLKPQSEDVTEAIKELYSAKDAILSSSASSRRVLYLFVYYEDQCNLEFTPEELRMLGELGLTLAISCVQLPPDSRDA